MSLSFFGVVVSWDWCIEWGQDSSYSGLRNDGVLGGDRGYGCLSGIEVGNDGLAFAR